jgi:hypothetical protein
MVRNISLLRPKSPLRLDLSSLFRLLRAKKYIRDNPASEFGNDEQS